MFTRIIRIARKLREINANLKEFDMIYRMFKISFSYFPEETNKTPSAGGKKNLNSHDRFKNCEFYLIIVKRLNSFAEGGWVWPFSSGEWPPKNPNYPVNPVYHIFL